jgi:ribosomal-protein-alanine N-acetyltransferase
MQEALGFSIEPMRREDVDEVLAIERDVFPLPWSRRAFLNEVDDAEISVARVARRALRVVGYAIAWRVVDELHIGNLAVAPDAQRQGIGRAILDHLIETAREHGLRYATLEVRISNAPAIGLYEGCGFRPIALRRGFYPDNGEDAMVMLREIDTRRAGER